MKTCFMMGHRDAPLSLAAVLDDVVERHIIGYGVTEFVVGSRGAFDRLAAQSVRRAKQRHPGVTLTLLLAYYPEKEQSEKGEFDGAFYPPGLEQVPKRYAIVRANRYMVEHADFLIAYAWQPGSNTKRIVDYAHQTRQRKGKPRLTVLGPEGR